MAEWRRMLIGIGPSNRPPQKKKDLPDPNLLFMHAKQCAHVRLFPLHSPAATVDKRKQRRRRRQTKRINEDAGAAPRL